MISACLSFRLRENIKEMVQVTPLAKEQLFYYFKLKCKVIIIFQKRS